jgi:hypothetical protein
MDMKRQFLVKGFPPLSSGGSLNVFTGFKTHETPVRVRMKAKFSPCGIICDDCDWFTGEENPQCPGCEAVEGKPFWGACETYACVKEHGVEHCGVCGEFPCDGFMSRYDPREGPVNAALRAGLLAYRTRQGDEKTFELSRKIQEKG